MLFPCAAIGYGTAVRLALLAAEPQVVLGLALLPLAALALAFVARARAEGIAAAAELALAVLVHTWITLIEAWRLD